MLKFFQSSVLYPLSSKISSRIFLDLNIFADVALKFFDYSFYNKYKHIFLKISSSSNSSSEEYGL